jgi:hypothetical protein
MTYALKQLRALRRRFRAFGYRISNYRYWRAKGIPVVRAWRKSDLTF